MIQLYQKNSTGTKGDYQCKNGKHKKEPNKNFGTDEHNDLIEENSRKLQSRLDQG